MNAARHRLAQGRLIRLFLVIALASLATACREESPSASGAEQSKQADEIRIASLSPAISIILNDLGLGDRIIGRHAFDESVDASLPVVGDQSGVDYEVLARLQPTHVLMQDGAGELPSMLVQVARDRHWELLELPLLQLNDIPNAVTMLSTEFADDAVRTRSEALQARMARAWRPRPELAPVLGRSLSVYWVSPIGVAGPGSFHHDLMLRLGFASLPETGAAYVSLDREDLKRLNPDSVFILSPEAGDMDRETLLAPWAELGLSAIENDRVAILDDWRFLTPSTAMIDLAEHIVVHAERWRDEKSPPEEITQSFSKE